MLTDRNLYGSNEVPAYTAAGLMWSALDLLGCEDIREGGDGFGRGTDQDAEEVELDAADIDLIARFETQAHALLQSL